MRLSRSLSALALLFVLVLAGCAGDRSEPSWTAENTPLVEREVFFGNPEKAGAQISPDGTKISYLAPVDGVLNVWVGPADDPAAAQAITHDTERGVRIHFWAFTNQHVVYLQDQAGDENWRVYVVDLDSGEVTNLTPLDNVRARIEEVSHLYPEEILIGLNDRNPNFHDLYRVNIKTGERTLVQQNDEGFAGYLTDDNLQVRFAQAFTPEGGAKLMRRTDEGWEPFLEIPADDAMTTNPAGFDKSGNVLYMVDSLGRDTAALVAYDLESGEQTVIGSDPKADLDDLMMQPMERTIQAVAFNYERKEWKILDESIQADLDYLKTVADGDIEVTDRSLDDKHWIVVYLLDDGPVRYYRYDREAKQATFLFTNRPALEGLPLVNMHPAVIPARDGLGLVSYYSLPVWTDADGDGIPAEPQPIMLWVHGGPWARDAWGYDPYHQWFANRGYAVLSVNFRGSTGFGKSYINAGNMEWGKKMHDDLLDAVDWAVAQGIADPDRVCIGGGSYGGYATLAGLTMTPDKFACGVDIVGPSNLITLFNSIPPYWKPMLDIFTTRVGDHRTEEGRALLAERSPLTYADQIHKPLLIGQGANDPRVNQAEADQIVSAMMEKSIPVTYVLYGDEGHGFARPENRLSFNAVTEAFLADILGGRVEPVGDDFEGSSIEIVEGAEHVRGLDEVVAAPAAE